MKICNLPIVLTTAPKARFQHSSVSQTCASLSSSDEHSLQQAQLKQMRLTQMAAGPRMQNEFATLKSYAREVSQQLDGTWSGPLAPGQSRPKDGLDAMEKVMLKAADLSRGSSRDFSLLLQATFVPNNQLGISDDDQSHHLNAYLLVGYVWGANPGSAGSFAHKIEQNRLDNSGDINLGMIGSSYGERLRACTTPDELKAWTRQLCSSLRQPATGLVVR